MLSCFLLLVNTQAQKSTTTSATPAKPKLVVGLVIDQMRWDFLHRFADRYSHTGFKRLVKDGFNCNNQVGKVRVVLLDQLQTMFS